jgi:TrmH family RNA methyltransferase
MLSKNLIKYIQSLHQKKQRDAEQCFLVEGPKVVEELLLSDHFPLKALYGTASYLSEASELLDRVGVSGTEIKAHELERISTLQSPNQVLAIFSYATPFTAPTQLTNWVLALDDIRDPGNLGTLIRIADWFGITQLVCSSHSADCYNPKVVQATMGSLARVECVYTDLPRWLGTLKDTPVWMTVLGGSPLAGTSSSPAGVLVVGNESHGISQEVLAYGSHRITIPHFGGAESLNAAVATGIVLGYVRGVHLP